MDIKIQAKDINIKFNGKYLFKNNLNKTMKKGNFYIIEGASGVGKTTFVNIINYFIKPDKGNVFWDSHKLDNIEYANKIRTKYIGFIPSNFIFIDDISVKENLKLVADINSINFNKKISEILEVLRFNNKNILLENLLDKKIYQLSNGQKEIVSIVRVLILNSHFIIADEVLRSFNDEDTQNILNILVEYLKYTNKGFLIISHKKIIKNTLIKSTDRLYLWKFKNSDEGTIVEEEVINNEKN